MEKNKVSIVIVLIFGITALIVGTIIAFVLVSNVADIEEDVSGYNTGSSTQSILTSSTATLTPVSNGISSSSVTAKNQTWLEFDGVNDFVNLSYILCPTELGFSFGVWGKFASNSTSGYMFGLGNSSLGANFVGFTKTNSNVTLNFQNASGQGYQIYSDIIFNDTDWHFYTMTYQNSVLSLYVDGIIASSTSTRNLTDTYSCFDNVFLGALGRLTTGNWFNGSLNDAFLVNYTLNINQINEIYRRTGINNRGLGIPIIYYHGIGGGYVNMSLSNFSVHMSILNESGYNTITTTQLLDWSNGLILLPDKPIMINFDDGYLASAVNGSLIMDTYGYVGIIGAITNLVPSGNSGTYANWTELQKLIDKGWEINSHAVNHLNLTNFSATFDMTNVTYELNQSRWDIYNNLGVMPKYFVYPYNAHNSTIDEECAKYYDVCSGDNEWGRYVYKDSNKTANEIFRIGLGDSTSNESLLNLLYVWRNPKIITDLNENSGTTAHDTSGNSNDGIISGATWDNDGVDVALTPTTDYTIDTSTGIFTIVNDDYSWAGLDASWSYDIKKVSTVSTDSLRNNFTAGIDNISSKIPTALTVAIIVVILSLLALLILFFKKISSVNGGL